MKIALIALLGLTPLVAQEIKLPPSLDHLADKASEVVDVTLDSSLLQLASRFLSDKDPDTVKIRKIVSGLKGIYVKSFQFDKTGEYLESDVEPLRAQLRAPGWSRIVGVRSRKGGDNADVFLKSDGGRISGLTIISAEPRELTIVHIIGAIDPEQLSDLSGQFGIPKLDVKIRTKSSGAVGKEE
jgi:hypothetical protein